MQTDFPLRKKRENPLVENCDIFQIYPRSFYESNEDDIGAIPGIIAKLDYFVETGITVLWVSPFYKSHMDDFSYNISDYCDVAALFSKLINEV